MEGDGPFTGWRKPPEDLDFHEPDSWYKGEHCHKFPYDRPAEVEDVLHGWKPGRVLITAQTKVLAFGSCFAEYFVKFLSEWGYNRWQLPAERHSHAGENLLIALPDTFENIFVIAQQFRWAFQEFTPKAKLWFTKDKREFEATEERREKVRRSFEEGDVFVITLGLSEVWFDQFENEPMWRTVPARLYEPGRYVCRSATVAETLQVFHELHRLVDRYLPQKQFIFTLSPIPLVATFRDQSAITANHSSKAILRAALDEFIGTTAIAISGRYHYFPSYELVLQLFEHPFLPDNRHIRPEVIRSVLNVFSRLYTDLPVENVDLPEGNSHVRSLEARVRELQQDLEAKEQVIRELDRAARERLDLINQLTSGTLHATERAAGVAPAIEEARRR